MDEMANANDAKIDGTMTSVMELINTHDVVWVVWQNSAKPGGVDAIIVKGVNRFREGVAADVSVRVRMTAIQCVQYEQAEALRIHVADALDRTH